MRLCFVLMSSPYEFSGWKVGLVMKAVFVTG